MKKLWIAAFALIGCKGSNVGTQGVDMLDFFEFEGNLDSEWEFAHEDVLTPYGMRARISNYEYREGYNFYEVTFSRDCRGQTDNCTEGEMIRKMSWNVYALAGVHLAGFQTPTSNHVFDPAIVVAEGKMERGDSVQTSTGGGTYTSTVDFVDCPVNLETFDNCAQLDIDTTDGTPDVVGSIWAINDYNVIALESADLDGLWQLVGHNVIE